MNLMVLETELNRYSWTGRDRSSKKYPIPEFVGDF
jgi:hypothetical protein